MRVLLLNKMKFFSLMIRKLKNVKRILKGRVIQLRVNVLIGVKLNSSNFMSIRLQNYEYFIQVQFE